MLDSPFLSEQRPPVPAALLKASVILCGIVPILLAFRHGESPDAISVVTALVAGALAFAGWTLGPNGGNSSPDSAVWRTLLLLSPFVGMAGLMIGDRMSVASVSFLFLLPVLVITHAGLSQTSRISKHIIVPALFGSIFMFVSSAIGDPAIGAFPAIIGALFVAVVRATLDIEEDIFENHPDQSTLEVEHHYRHKLAITAVIFFLFGTVSLWPWLGEIYGKTYFWVLLLGVLIPLAFFWGRIRQPKIEGARTALIRFNRIAPIIGLIHVVAFLAA